MVDERSRAFGYLVAFGSVGQTVAALICPHLNWRWMFLSFGSFGFVWCFFWIVSFKEIRISSEDDDFIIISPKSANRINWIDYFKHPQLWSIYLAHFAMMWTSNIITVWLPFYLSKQLGVKTTALSFTAVPYIINSFASIFAGHFADSLIVGNWTVLSVRRIMTLIGLIGPAFFLLIFMAVDNLVLAISIISICMALMAFNSSGHLANHLDVAPNYSAITFGISNTIATIPGIICGPLTAELVVQSGGRWSPVFLIAAAVNSLGAIIYYSHSGANQII
jgi:MFS family permease